MSASACRPIPPMRGALRRAFACMPPGLKPLRRIACVASFALLLASTGSLAAGRDDYARQWPLVLPAPDAGAYRVTLDREVYRSAADAALRDVDVFNAQGGAVSTALFAADAPAAAAPTRVELPWFPLPPGKAARGGDITLYSERADDGTIRRVEARVDAAATTADAATTAWLIDASRQRAPISALELDWPAQSAPLDVAVRVEGSDDLRDWTTLQPQARLLDLSRGGRRLRQARIPLQGQARYLRVVTERADAVLPLTRVRAEIAGVAEPTDWRWEILRGRPVVERGTTHYDFRLDGRFPITRADLEGDGNAAGEWTLSSRDTEDAPWIPRAGPWVAFAVAGAERSPPQPLEATVRDRHWRLTPSAPVATPPALRLGYRPESLVFLSQGDAPYALVAGSARAVRRDAPLQPMLDAMRTQRGAGWTPAPATLGPPLDLAGAAALAPRRDWSDWLLWALLLVGAALVAGFAFSLLRARPAEPPPPG